MKICPNCDFENIDNPENCGRCRQNIINIRPESFTIIDFIQKNAEVYAVFGIFITLFQYLFSSSDQNLKAVSVCLLFVAIYLMFSLIIKAERIVTLQSHENPFNRFFNSNEFEFQIFLAINVLIIMGLLLNIGPQYILSICILSSIAAIFGIFNRNISNERDLRTMLIWFNLIGIFFIELGWLTFQIFLPYIQNPTDPTIFYWTMMIPLTLLGIGLGIFLANMLIGGWIMVAELRRNRATHIQYSWESVRQEITQYIQIFNETPKMKILVGFMILIGLIVFPTLIKLFTDFPTNLSLSNTTSFHKAHHIRTCCCY